MKRLAFALVTGVGLFLHREWKKRQQMTLSESRYRQDEKLLYAYFKFLLDKGYELDESRTAYTYKLEFEKEEHSLIFLMKHPQVLNSYLITSQGDELSMEELLEQSVTGYMGADSFSKYEDFLKVYASKVDQYIDEEFISP